MMRTGLSERSKELHSSRSVFARMGSNPIAGIRRSSSVLVERKSFKLLVVGSKPTYGIFFKPVVVIEAFRVSQPEERGQCPHRLRDIVVNKGGIMITHQNVPPHSRSSHARLRFRGTSVHVPVCRNLYAHLYRGHSWRWLGRMRCLLCLVLCRDTRSTMIVVHK